MIPAQGESRAVGRFNPALPYLAFVLTGIVNTLLGPILPWFSERWSLPDADAGAFFTIQFATSLAAGIGSSLVSSRVGELRTIGLGLAWMAAGLVAIAVGSRPVALIGIAGSGIGLGLAIPTTNILVARAFPAKASAALSGLNLAWGMGAAAWPLIVAVAPATEAALLAVAVTLTAMSVLCVASSARPVHATAHGTARPAGTRVAWQWIFFASFFFLYGGTEPAVGGWVTEFAHRLDPRAPATIAAAAFWAGLTAGRGAVALFVVERREADVAMGGVTLATLALALLLASESVTTAAIVAAVVGFGFAPLFPITVAVLSRSSTTGWAGPLISLTSIGGAIIPWLVGIASTMTGSLRAGLLVPLAGCVLVGLLHASFWSRRRPLQTL